MRFVLVSHSKEEIEKIEEKGIIPLLDHKGNEIGICFVEEKHDGTKTVIAEIENISFEKEYVSIGFREKLEEVSKQ